jgi:anti-anti-sigma factor
MIVAQANHPPETRDPRRVLAEEPLIDDGEEPPVIAEVGRRPPVFDVVGRPTSQGVTWIWAQDDLDFASVGRARAQLAALFTAGACPYRLLVYLGAECFVDLRGLRLLLALAAEVQRCGGALAVVAPPHSLRKMISVLALQEELPMVDSVRQAAVWARTGKEA